MPPVAKVPEVKGENPVLLDRSVHGEISDHLGPWACLVLKDPSGCRFQERLAALDQRETPVTLAYLDRKVYLDLLVASDRSDQLE